MEPSQPRTTGGLATPAITGVVTGPEVDQRPSSTGRAGAGTLRPSTGGGDAEDPAADLGRGPIAAVAAQKGVT